MLTQKEIDELIRLVDVLTRVPKKPTASEQAISERHTPIEAQLIFQQTAHPTTVFVATMRIANLLLSTTIHDPLEYQG